MPRTSHAPEPYVGIPRWVPYCWLLATRGHPVDPTPSQLRTSFRARLTDRTYQHTAHGRSQSFRWGQWALCCLPADRSSKAALECRLDLDRALCCCVEQAVGRKPLLGSGLPAAAAAAGLPGFHQGLIIWVGFLRADAGRKLSHDSHIMTQSQSRPCVPAGRPALSPPLQLAALSPFTSTSSPRCAFHNRAGAPCLRSMSQSTRASRSPVLRRHRRARGEAASANAAG
eukprot:SAG22_NODE_636_length_8333_cov_2.919116_5_plen_228_part_00